jgi:hypothetical protein
MMVVAVRELTTYARVDSRGSPVTIRLGKELRADDAVVRAHPRAFAGCGEEPSPQGAERFRGCSSRRGHG